MKKTAFLLHFSSPLVFSYVILAIINKFHGLPWLDMDLTAMILLVPACVLSVIVGVLIELGY